MTHRDPLFALRRTARNLQNAHRVDRYPELDVRLERQTKPLYIVFVHGGQSCGFDAFGDLFKLVESRLPAGEGHQDVASFLRFEHDTYHPVGVNSERLCRLVVDKLACRTNAEREAELILIAHSRGGLVARLASDHLIERGLWSADRLEVFTYGSPHRGTPFFESEVTWAVDSLIRFAGLLRYGSLRFLYRVWRNGLATEIRCHARTWVRRGALLGRISTPSVLTYRQLAANFFLRGAASTRTQGPLILKWPPGIEDVRESSEFIRNLSPVPRCPRFWAFGSSYDVRTNSQRLDIFSKHVLRMVQRAFVLISTSKSELAARHSTERNDLVVSLESATAVGMACRVNENLWHCGYFRAAPGETLAQYLQGKIFARSSQDLSRGPARAHYVDPEFVDRTRPPIDEPTSPKTMQRPSPARVPLEDHLPARSSARASRRR